MGCSSKAEVAENQWRNMQTFLIFGKSQWGCSVVPFVLESPTFFPERAGGGQSPLCKSKATANNVASHEFASAMKPFYQLAPLRRLWKWIQSMYDQKNCGKCKRNLNRSRQTTVQTQWKLE